MEEIQYVKSALNPSDLSTKATARVSELGPESFHQTGPDFLSLPRDSWPVYSNFDPVDIPADELRLRDRLVFSAAARFNFCHSQVHQNNPWRVVEELLQYSNNIQKVIRIIARYLRGLEAGLRKNNVMTIDNPVAYTLVAADPKKLELQTAERLLLLHGMVHTQEALEAGKLTSLLPSRDGKLIVTRGRLGEQSLERLLGVSCLPILMPESRVAYLYMVAAHCGEFGLVHRSLVSTLARSRRKVWIVRGHDLAKKVVNSCPRCDMNRKVMLVQQMADIKQEQLTVAPPWTNVALDFAGPFIVKGQVNKRAKMKVWILVYSCRATKAVCLLVVPGYSTADFLNKHAEFVYRKGRPASVVSDRGSQLVAAGVTVANQDLPINKLDWKKVVSQNSATDWTFVPVGSQHRKGISESTVKVMKKSLALAINPGVELTYSEMVTLLSKITFSINTRPLTLASTSPSSQQEDVMLPLTLNHSLLGRSTIETPAMDFDEADRFSARLAYVQQVYQAWWDRWIQDVLPTLVPCRRWKDAMKNLKPGDIVYFKLTESKMSANWRIGKVEEVKLGQDGYVRQVTVAYKDTAHEDASDWVHRAVDRPVRNMIKLFHIDDTSLLEDIQAVFKLSAKILEEEKLSFDDHNQVEEIDPSEDTPIDDQDLVFDEFEETVHRADEDFSKKPKKNRRTELEKLQIDMRGWNLVDNTMREIPDSSRSFQQDLRCCREALFKMDFVYCVVKAKVMSAEQNQPFSMQAVMKSAAPFINNTVPMENENYMQENMTMKCGHVGHGLEADGVGGRFGEMADELFDNVLTDNIFDDNLDIFLL